MKHRCRIAGLMLAVLATACAGNPQPGESGYAYNVNGDYNAEFVTDDGTVITGTMQLTTEGGGVVTGTLALSNPFTVDGEVEGLVIGSEFTLTLLYTIAETGCSGVATGGGEISEGGTSVQGSMAIEDECGDAPSSTSFSLALP